MAIDSGIKVNALVSTFLACAIVSFALRVYVRTRITKSFGADDIWMAFALVVYIGNSACNFKSVQYGLTRPASEGFEPTISEAIEFWWLCNLTYCVAMVLVKTSVGIFLLRFAMDIGYRWILYCAIAANVLIGIIFFALGLVMCVPVQYIWDRNRPNGGECLSPETLLTIVYVYSIVSVTVDFVFALSPIFLMWRLNLSLWTRILLIPIFGLACLASIAVLIRFAYVDLLSNNNFLHLAADFVFWCDVESGMAILAANLATLRPLFRKISSNLGCSTSRDSRRARFKRLGIASIRPSQWAAGVGEKTPRASRIRNSLPMPIFGRIDRERRPPQYDIDGLRKPRPAHLQDEKRSQRPVTF